MQRLDLRAWMLAEAVELLQAADRLQRQFFQIGRSGPSDASPCWEPPVDMYENDRGLSLLIALPGVAPERFDVTLEPQAIVVRGDRTVDASFSPGTLLRLEIPYGRFERRIDLPDGDYQLADMQLENGCLRLHLEKLK